MRKLLKRSSIAMAGLAVLAAALLLFGHGGDSASATHGTSARPPVPFPNNYIVGLSGVLPVTPGANSGPAATPEDVIQFASQGIFDPTGAFPPLFTPRFGGHVPSSGMFFTPADWFVYPGEGIPPFGAGGEGLPPLPNGSVVGGSFTAFTGGLANGPCLGTPPVPAPIRDAETDSTNVIVSAPNFTNLIVDVLDPTPGHGVIGDTNFPNADVPGSPHGHNNSVADGADYYPDILASAVPTSVGDPWQRSYIQLPGFLGTTTNVVADIVTYAPDQLVPLGIPAGKGWATVVIVQNFNPALAPTPSTITDQCGWETSLLSPAGLRVNPATPGTKIFYSIAQSRLDADGDGFDNDQDRCPFSPDPAFPLSAFGPFPPSFMANFPLDPDLNGIPVSCDPGTPPLAAGVDGDLDSFPNAQDNCPQVSNILQLESEPPLIFVPSPTGPSSDSIGDACDPNPTVADGHFHTVEAKFAVCITGGGVVDTDGDGWCDPDETSLGSDPNDPTSTPEDSSIQSLCDDGVDNDGDNDIDLGIGTGTPADSGCLNTQQHDLELVRVVGARSVCTSTNTTGIGHYTIQLRNNSGVAETAELGIRVVATSQGGSGAEVTGVSGADVTGPVLPLGAAVNDDGDPFGNADWSTDATVVVGTSGVTIVTVQVQFPDCGSEFNNDRNTDYTVSVDVCHGDDIPPLALFGALPPWTCGAPADGGQDANFSNDTPITVQVNDKSK